MADTNIDSILGRIVIERNLCTDTEVKECIEKVKKYNRAGKPRSLAEVLHASGYVTRTQLKRVSKVAEEAKPAQKIPGFQILEKLGSGAMATVFKAKQVSLDRMVAIKVLPNRLSENPEYVARFYKEGKAAAMLNHRNIVQAIDVGEAGGYHYFVMEYVKGKTVYDDLSKNKVYKESDALDITIQIAEALAHAHAKNLIHRDVKPKNVMLTEDGIAKLADMGLAREMSDMEAAQQEAGRAYGTPYYIAPEQIRGEIDIDARADIYALGAMLYHMITGKVPFDAPTPSAVMHKHLKQQLVPPDHLNKELSLGVAEVVEVMMAKDRNERYANVKLLLEDLHAVRNGEAPLHARTRFNDEMLEGLEQGQIGIDHALENVLDQGPEQTGLKMALIISLGALFIAIIVIVMILSQK
ncbi:MAG: serine/threonine protein kinase [Phycisphaerae bacterium]|nr:serine/threonine protein kinase [Phycisphaerae bacterium]